MSDLRSFTKDFMTEFIELYKSFPCLWRTKCKDYMNRSKKDAAYNVLLKELQEIEPNSTKNTVKAKINSIRGSFRREMKKIEESKRSGAGTDEIYVTHLWYYDLLLFCKDQEVPRASVNNMDDRGSERKSDQENEDEGEETQNVDEEQDVDSIIQTPPPRPISHSSTTSRTTIHDRDSTPASSTASKRLSKKRNEKIGQQEAVVLTMIGDRLRTSATNNDDPCYFFGQNVGAKLRTLSKETRLYTEKLINDLLFEAEMGNIDKYTRIVTSPPDVSSNQIYSQLATTEATTNNSNTGVNPPNQCRTYVQDKYQLPHSITNPYEPSLHEMQPSSNIYQSHNNTSSAQVLSQPHSENSISSFFGNYQPNIED